jgi:hypothetical protein
MMSQGMMHGDAVMWGNGIDRPALLVGALAKYLFFKRPVLA